MEELILNTFSPSLNLMNIKYINVIYNNEYPDNLNIDFNKKKFDKLNKTYPQYKKNNKINTIKHKLTRSFSFDL
jgi:hypothetical protein